MCVAVLCIMQRNNVSVLVLGFSSNLAHVLHCRVVRCDYSTRLVQVAPLLAPLAFAACFVFSSQWYSTPFEPTLRVHCRAFQTLVLMTPLIIFFVLLAMQLDTQSNADRGTVRNYPLTALLIDRPSS